MQKVIFAVSILCIACIGMDLIQAKSVSIDLMLVAQDCEKNCPLSLNCSEWNHCAFHYPDDCKGFQMFCDDGENEIPLSKITNDHTSKTHRSDPAYVRSLYQVFSFSVCLVLFGIALYTVIFVILRLPLPDEKEASYNEGYKPREQHRRMPRLNPIVLHRLEKLMLRSKLKKQQEDTSTVKV